MCTCLSCCYHGNVIFTPLCAHHHGSPWQQTLQSNSSDEDERGATNPVAMATTIGAWVDEEDDIMRSDSLTVLIESDPIAAAAVMNDNPTSSDVVRAQQEELEVHPLTLESAHTARHGNSSTADTKLTNSGDTEKLLP